MLKEWSDRNGKTDQKSACDLFTELERLTSRLKEVEGELGSLIVAGDNPRMQTTSEVATAMLKFRQKRNQAFPGLFGEPAWDILLSLAALKPERPYSPVSSIGYAADVPQTTAVRQLALLEVAGLIERSAHPTDGRVTLIRLTAQGRERIQRLLERWPLAIIIVAAPLAMIFKLFS